MSRDLRMKCAHLAQIILTCSRSPKGESGIPPALRAAALRMVAEGATLKAAGAAVGVSRQRVFQWAQAEGVKVGKRRKGKAQANAAREPVAAPAPADARTVSVRGISLARRA